MQKDFREFSETELQDRLFQRGWVTAEVNDIPRFQRSYARVNALLAGVAWNETIAATPSYLQEQAPYLSRGFAIHADATETEVDVEIFGYADDKVELIKVNLADKHFYKSGFEDIEPEAFNEWLLFKGNPGDPATNSKEYYEQNERSAELRILCLELIKYYEIVIATGGRDDGALGSLMDMNSRLSELAVVPRMHTGAKRVEFIDPIKRVEWLAGQLRDILHHGHGLQGNARAIIEEHNLLHSHEGSGRIVIDQSENSEATKLVYLQMNLLAAKKMLDANAENDRL